MKRGNRVKWSCLIIALSLSSGIYANCCTPFSGFYAGVAAGIVTNSADMRLVTSGNNGEELVGMISESVLVTNGIDKQTTCKESEIKELGEIYAGWGCQFANQLYLGIRIGANFSRYSIDEEVVARSRIISSQIQNTSVVSDKIRTRLWTTEYTFDFKPGFVFCSQTMLFGIFGVAFNEGRMAASSQTRTVILLGLPVLVTDNAPFDIQDKKRQGALRLGFGLEQQLSKCLSLELSYVYTTYQRLEGKLAPLPSNAFGPRTAAFSSRPKRQFLTIGFSYHL